MKFQGDKLDAIFQGQKEIIDKLKEKFPDRQMTRQDLIAAMHNELEELRDSFPWKKWKGSYDDMQFADIKNAKMEAVDILFFLTEFMIIHLGMNANDVMLEYEKKFHENMRRYKNGY